MKLIAFVLTLALQSAMTFAALAEPAPARPDQPVVATVTLPHAKVLAGVPFDIAVTLTNVSNRPATVGLIANLVVSFPDGRTVLFQRPGGNDHWLLKPHNEVDTSIQLAPGESTQKVASWDHVSIPNWFRYDSFSGPGTYEIALQLERGIDDHQYNDHLNYVGVLRTSSARLERAVPLGEDEILWNRMQEAADGRWSDDSFAATKAGAALAAEIVQLHPASGYYPYALLLHRRFKNRHDIAPLVAAAERFSASPAFPYLWKAAGDAALYEAQDPHDDASAAKKFYDLAETYYRQALKTNSLGIRGGGGAEAGLRLTMLYREKLKVR